ncbi:hypothetical protein MCHI_001326 [Candidatus Magnetoovum chiemensis]|nr:hypothetical protein MCHI_001326 [Candidatus Magnetoovum chiemensis]
MSLIISWSGFAFADEAEKGKIETFSQKTKLALREIGQYVKKRRNDYKNQFYEELRYFDGTIESLKQDSQKIGAAFAQVSRIDLFEARNKATRKLNKLLTESGAAFDDMRFGAAAAFDDLHQAYNKARSRFE